MAEQLRLAASFSITEPTVLKVRFRDRPARKVGMHYIDADDPRKPPFTAECGENCQHCLNPRAGRPYTKLYFDVISDGRSFVLPLPVSAGVLVENALDELGRRFYRTEFEIERRGFGIKTQWDLRSVRTLI